MNIKKYKKNAFPILLCFLCCWGLFNCKGKDPVTPDVPFQYINKVEVIYSRIANEIDLSSLTDKASLNTDNTTLHYELFDPDAETRSDNDQKVEGQYRYGQLEMTKVGDNSFKGYIEQVLIQANESHKKHLVCVQDPAISSGNDPTSQYTGQNIVITGSCYREIVSYSSEGSGTKLKFKISAGGG